MEGEEGWGMGGRARGGRRAWGAVVLFVDGVGGWPTEGRRERGGWYGGASWVGVMGASARARAGKSGCEGARRGCRAEKGIGSRKDGGRREGKTDEARRRTPQVQSHAAPRLVCARRISAALTRLPARPASRVQHPVAG